MSIYIIRCKIYLFSYTNKSSKVNCTCAIDEYVLGRSPNVVIKVVIIPWRIPVSHIKSETLLRMRMSSSFVILYGICEYLISQRFIKLSARSINPKIRNYHPIHD